MENVNYPDLRCYEQQINCPEQENHDAMRHRARDECQRLRRNTQAAQVAFQTSFGQVLQARSLQDQAENHYREMRSQRDMANSMMQAYEGAAGNRSNIDDIQRLCNDASRNIDTVSSQVHNAQVAVDQANRDVDTAEREHDRECKMCCFTVFCRDCGVNVT